jgi:hypothetical protein
VLGKIQVENEMNLEGTLVENLKVRKWKVAGGTSLVGRYVETFRFPLAYLAPDPSFPLSTSQTMPRPWLPTFRFPLTIRAKLLTVLFPLVFLVPSLFAQDLQIKASVNPSQIQIGDRFQYHIEVSAPAGVTLDLPGLVGNLGSFEVKDMTVTEPKIASGRTTRSWDLTLSTFIGGDFLLPPQIVEGIQGQDTLRSNTEPVAVRVLARIKDTDEDILDIEAPIQDPNTPWWVWLIVGVVSAVVLFFLGRYLWKRFKHFGAVPVLPPYEEALQNLALLRARHLLAQNLQAEFYFEEGQILRRYLHRRFHADVLDATTSELAERVQLIPEIKGKLGKDWVEYCRRTDLVKFAKDILPPELCNEFEKFVDDLVYRTRPYEDPLKKKEGT